MRTIIFAQRNFKEIVRDPVSIIFAVILPLFLLYIFQQFKIPNEIYNIENFTPGIIIFSLAFITMFTASLVAKDRCSSLTARLGVSPMKSINYILGYILSVIPLILIQNILFFITAIILGLKFSSNSNINIIHFIRYSNRNHNYRKIIIRNFKYYSSISSIYQRYVFYYRYGWQYL